MNIFEKIYCRAFQFLFKVALPLLPYRQPNILENNNEVVDLLKNKGHKNILFVTDKTIRGLGLTKSLEDALTNAELNVTVYDEVLPNPTISQIEKGLLLYKENLCDSIIALGGGSVMDCAKVIGARAVKPKQPVEKMKGLLKIGKRLPLLIAIPTTAGTGSETTLAAVITDDKTHHKYPINDFNLIPHYALLDYHLTLGLNKKITSTTGMDALTHAVEAFIGRSTTKQTRAAALEAIKLIYENLKNAYDDGSNATARQNMLKASYLAGVAFTKSYVGYSHAIAHSLGGKYGVPHGLANAIILPVILKEYGKSVYKKLSKISLYIGMGKIENTPEQNAKEFIAWIEELNRYFEIPSTVDSLKAEDIDCLSKLAAKEGNPLYPVPKLMNEKELAKVYEKLLVK